MRYGVAIVLLAFLLACSRGGVKATKSGGTATSERDLAGNALKLPAPIERPDFYDSGALWRRQELAGGVRESPSDRFAAGEPVAVFVKAREVPTGLAATVAIEGPRGEVSRQRRPIPKETRFVILRFFDTARWPPGEYRARIFLGGDEVDDRPFHLTGRGAK